MVYSQACLNLDCMVLSDFKIFFGSLRCSVDVLTPYYKPVQSIIGLNKQFKMSILWVLDSNVFLCSFINK